MSTDAFAASIGKGAALTRTRLPAALRIGLIFGVVETITPVIGWAIGLAASRFVSEWDHWIAFFLLAGLGAHMMWEGFKPADDSAKRDEPRKSSFWMLVATAFATSIDAMAIGVTLAFAKVNIVVAALSIGVATTVMVTAGIMLGRAIGALIGKRAEMLGGLVLIAIGAAILYEHLFVQVG
ncbi:putative manganese efflux pump MntP [Salinicola rhizosphaerae]|uniref:Putative manganese efflux pump MntP n=2 Tax=Salinicola rhizosphaerae TaxID=1443141 RepID=A0ABQ3DVG7_9GAMM|nr:putative manganese efflux pump MntP [Salinicola rhizosphaerae]